ncbi:MAG TPA: S46 family peptidase, partial [Povalibacter sp.]
MHRLALTILTWALLAVPAARADEGMWTTFNFPSATVRQKYNVTIDNAWLQRAQRSVTRHESGCTGSFASGDGLVLTNHHCVAKCLQENSTPSSDLLTDGFHATTRADEKRCQTEILSVLVDTQDVTSEVNRATAGLPNAQANDVRKQTLSKLEDECVRASKKAKAGPIACESVSLYQGGQYFL